MHPTAQSVERLGLFLLIGLVVWLIWLTWYTLRVLTRPYRRTYASALARGTPGDPSELPPGPHGPRTFTSWEFDTAGLRLPVWDCPGDRVDGPVIVLSHGWGDSRIGGLSRVQRLAPFASRLILWDIPGHGDAPGTCTLGTHEVAALFALLEQLGGPVVLYGWSLGAGVSIATAAIAPTVAAVIAEAPYRVPITPARNVMRGVGLPWRMNLAPAMSLLGIRFGVGPRWRGFDRAALATSLTAPLLVLHGEEDEVCPLEDGRAIAAAASRGTFVPIPGGRHHGLWTDPALADVCAARVEAFLRQSQLLP